ncbi:hypothetical protein DRO33_02910 [Candidatus Bathyarchaeota archaeon]|nr:MAG: hypothetical protein DRO33_02910 [Candidatus Bathyarchaeota archaeon]
MREMIIPAFLLDVLKFLFDFTLFFLLGPGVLIYMMYRLILRGQLRRFFIYEKKDSFFHRLDPRAKLVWAMTVAVLGALLEDIVSLTLIFAWIVIMWLTAKPPREKLITAFVLILPVPVNAIFFQGIRYCYDWWSQSFICPVTSVYEMHPALDYILGGHVLTVQGMLYGATQSLRVIIAMSSALLLAVSTAPNALLLGLTNFIKIGKERIGLPYVISFAVVIGIRLIPTMFEDANIVINAARVRGLTMQVTRSRNPIKVARSLVKAARYFIYMTVPLIISSLRRGSNMAIAADLRAFRAKPYRTYLIERRMNRADIAFTLLSLGVLAAGLYYAFVLGAIALPGLVI